MKNYKLKTGLTAVAVIAIFVALVLMLISVLTESDIPQGASAGGMVAYEPFFYTFNMNDASDGFTFGIDWEYAGIYFALLLVAFLAWVTKTCMFTIPSVQMRNNNSSVLLLCDMLVLIGILFAIIGLFLPAGMEIIFAEYDGNAEGSRMAGTRILTMLGTPLAFMSALGTIGLTFKTK